MRSDRAEDFEPSAVTLEDAEALHRKLSPEERDELLQCLLTAAPRGGEAMIEVIEAELLCHATEHLLSEISGAQAHSVPVLEENPEPAKQIATFLAAYARQQESDRPEAAVWTPDAAAQSLILDLEENPHAFLMGCLAQRASNAERAWAFPYRLKERLGTLDVWSLADMAETSLTEVMGASPALHRLYPAMASNVHSMAARLVEYYGGDAGRIWGGSPSAATVIRRLLEFEGVGIKIATMTTALLVKFFAVPMRDLHFLDLPIDVQIRRVLQRLGLVHEGDADEVMIWRARELWPEFPGMVDVALWEVGRELCRPTNPKCDQCFLAALCPSAGARLAPS
jgi:endonuclease III